MEQAHASPGRRIVVSGPHGMDADEALLQLGLKAADADTVVYLCRFTDDGPPRLVSTSAIGGEA